MAAGKLIIGTKVDSSGFSEGLKKLEGQTDSSSNKIIGSFKKIAAGVAAAFTVDKIVSFGKECVNAARQAQEAETKLNEVMKTRMHATSGQVGQVNKLIQAETKSGVVGGTAQKSGAQQLATYLHSTKALKTLIPAMNDLAVQQKGTSATGEDLVNISNMMGKVFTGQVGALKRVGISFDENSEKILKNGTEQQKAAELAKVITENVGNMNQKMAQTPSGQIAQAKMKMAALKKEVGEGLMPVVAQLVTKGTSIAQAVLPPIVNGLKNTMQFLKQHQAILPGLAIAIGIVTTAVAIQSAAQAIKAAMNTTETTTLGGLIAAKMADAAATFVALAPYLLIAAAIAAVIAVIVLLVKHWGQVTAAAGRFKDAVVGAFKAVIDWFKSIPAKIQSVWHQVSSHCLNGAKKAGDNIKAGFHAGIEFFKNLPKNFKKWGAEMIQHLIAGIKSKIKDVEDAVKGVGNKIKSFLHFSVPDEGPLKDIDTWMPDMMDLLAQGMTDNLGTVDTASQAVANTIKKNTSNIKIDTPKTQTSAATTGQTDQTANKDAQDQSYSAIPAQAASATQQAQQTVTLSMAQQAASIMAAAPNMNAAASTTFSTIPTAAQHATSSAKQTSNSDISAAAAFIRLSLGNYQNASYTTFNAVPTAASDRGRAANQVVRSNVQQMINYMRSQYGAFQNIGSTYMQDVANGMNSKRATVTSTASDLVNAIKNKFIQGLGIHSPARFGVYVGNMLGAGIINGLNESQLGKYTRSTANDMKNAFGKNQFDANVNVDYMDDDSMKEVTWMRKFDGGSVVHGQDGGKGGRFVNNMLKLVNDDSHGYSQSNRWGPDYDCSSSIITALKWAGFDTGNASYTGNMSSELTKHGWERLPYKSPKRGDILLNDATHVEMSLGNGNNAGFHSAHGHPETGDQAHEAYVGRDPGGWAAILRYKNGFGDSLADAIEEAYSFKKFGFGSMDEEGDSGGAASGSLGDWVRAALELTHQPMSLASGLIRAAKSESGGNPRAVNNWDINAKLGHPSKGLMQMIDGTFNAYKLPGHDNIWNPVDNTAAAIMYMIKHYGSIEAVLRPRSKKWYGYAVGSRFINRDQFAQIHAGEAVIKASENPYANSKGGFLTAALQEGVNAVMADFANKVAVRAAGANETIVTNNNDMTQNVYFQETPRQPSQFRAELRQAGRRLAFGN